ncbi:MAG TPA: preprotein translocase YidC [Eubacterium sp.]|jgi:YidC/Oxa1 family membrane protein insertase|nr:preprotein translocase YidC [Eubacterium sp.]HAZ87431.1 preprotein translocase YidC [Eubacterium sp.]
MILLRVPILGDIIDFIALLMGYIMQALFFITGGFNIGLCIILFTIIVRLIMMPMTIKQQRFSKLSAMMQPEIAAIQNKYKGKNDTASIQKMQLETKAVYEKYGTSPTGGCLQMFIQLPIFYGIFAVVRDIPYYVPRVKALFEPVISAITGVTNYNQVLIDSGLTTATYDTEDALLRFLNAFSSEQWETLKNAFTSYGNGISDTIAQQSEKILHVNNFFGINLATAPGFKLSLALLIPLLAGLTQWLSVKLMQSKNPVNNDDENNTAAQSMKMMNTMMPVISAVFCVSMPSGLGLYWIMGSVVQCIQQIFINKYMDKVDVEKLIAKNMDKVNKKRAKKGLPPKKVDTSAVTNYEEAVQRKEDEVARRGERAKEIKESTEYYNQNAKPGSLAAKANMVKMYNEKNSKN